MSLYSVCNWLRLCLRLGSIRFRFNDIFATGLRFHRFRSSIFSLRPAKVMLGQLLPVTVHFCRHENAFLTILDNI